MNEKRQRLARILDRDMSDRFFALPFRAARDFQVLFRQLAERGVIGERRGRRREPVRLFPVKALRFRGQPIKIRTHQLARAVLQAQREEVDRARIRQRGMGKNLVRAVGSRIHRGFLRELLGHVEIVDFRGQLQAWHIVISAADHPHGMIVVGIQRMQRLHRPFRSEVSAAGPQIIVVKVPDH